MLVSRTIPWMPWINHGTSVTGNTKCKQTLLNKKKKIIQLCPQLNIGGVERGVIDVAIYLQEVGYESIVISNGGLLLSELQDKQIRHIKLPIHSKNPLIFVSNLWRLRTLLKTLKPDLLLPYSRIPCWLIYFLQKKLKTPFITHCLGTHSMGLLGLKKKYNSVLLRGDKVIANSDFTKTYFERAYQVPLQKIAVVHRSVDLGFFNGDQSNFDSVEALKRRWNVVPGKIVVVLPARFASWKGHEVLIQALTLIQEKQINVFYLVFVGDHQENSSYYKRLQKLVAELALNKQVFFAGSSDNMPDVYRAADIVASCSTKPEAFGRTLIEAQAMGKLVIASGHGGVLETIKDQVDGFLVEPGNAQELADLLIQIYKMTPSEKSEVANNAKINALRFSKDRMCAGLVGHYESLFRR